MLENEKNEEALEILKRLKVLEPDTVENSLNNENNDAHEKKENGRLKGILLTMLGLVTIGGIGYQGFNALQENNNKEMQNSTLVKSMEIQNTTKKEEIIPTEETLPIKADPQNVEEVNKPLIASVTTPPVVIEKEPTPTPIPAPEPTPIVSKPTPIKAEEPIAKIVETVKPEETVKPKEIVKKEIENKKIENKEPVKTAIVKKAKSKSKIRIVREGDTLASIAEKFYGNPMDFKRIIRANPSIRNEHSSLHIGDKIIIPEMEDSKKRRMVIIKKGYTLAYLSKRFYGNSNKVQKIVDANYNIKNKDSMLHLGQKVYIPR